VVELMDALRKSIGGGAGVAKEAPTSVSASAFKAISCTLIFARRTTVLPKSNSSGGFAIGDGSASFSLLELDHRSQSENLGISQCFAGIVSQRIGCAPAGMNDVLEIRLQRPAGADLILVDSGEQAFETANRSARPG
jgi:hypothetical protein